MMQRSRSDIESLVEKKIKRIYSEKDLKNHPQFQKREVPKLLIKAVRINLGETKKKVISTKNKPTM